MSRSLRIPRRTVAAAAVAAALAGTLAPAAADGPRRHAALLPAYVQECGACHVAYPPSLLGASSWQRVMAGLAHHYGTDASLDAASRASLAAWLGAEAGRGRRAQEAPPEDRITRSAWFVHEHDEVSAAAWRRPAVRSAANCAACHPRAERGNYDEHDIRIPR